MTEQELRHLPAFEPLRYTEPNEKGYMTVLGTKTFRELEQHIHLHTLDLTMEDGTPWTNTWEYFGGTYRFEHAKDAELPRWRWVSVYAVTGGSEGYYVHVDALVDEDAGDGTLTCHRLFTGKLFSSMSQAYEHCNILAHLLGA